MNEQKPGVGMLVVYMPISVLEVLLAGLRLETPVNIPATHELLVAGAHDGMLTLVYLPRELIETKQFGNIVEYAEPLVRIQADKTNPIWKKWSRDHDNNNNGSISRDQVDPEKD